VMREQNIVDGSEIAKKVSELLKSENGVTMAYCRLGETIYHYLIDEFQDTSRVQFESMKPLIDNAISVGGTVFVVGDKKQSIYGWRGGDYTLFDELKNFNQETMKNNYRSGKKIVQFNNETFENLKKNDTFLNHLKKIFLEDESFNDTFKNVYENVEQDLINEFEGHVDICLISEKDFNTDEDKKDILYEFYKNRLINVLISLFNRGYKASDILILVRENDTIPTIIDWVYSEQSLRWLQFITDGNLRIKSDFNIKKILLCALYFINTDDPFYEGALKELWINVINEKRDGHIVVSPYEFFVGIVESLQLQKDIYVKTFLEEVNCLVNKGLTIREILNYFETNDVSLTMGYDIDAIRIMSIHKSKGLEGKVVILPCYDWELNKTIKNLFDTVDLSYFYEDTKGKIFGDMKKLRIFSKKIQDKYNKKLIAEIIENINLMYVANTRAVEELYITGCYSLNEDGNYPKVLKTSSLLNMVIGEEYKNSECSQDKSSNVDMDKIFKEISTPNDMEEKGSKNVKFYRFRKNFVTEPLYDDVLEGGRRGVLIHNLLSKIDVIPDNVEVEEFVEKFLDKQGSGTQVYDDLKKILIKTISDLKDYFYEVNACWTEKEFVTDDGTILRLDRLVKKGDHYTVIDFKTGDKKESDKGQIKRYCNLLPFNVTGVIYYLKTGEKLNV
ncbi:MAG: UvrD-helicase domain-containing protein, partial [Calditerrivibrio sp.]|nr:UvrD-helicase domain-containing protein [Calditerrivibrio sp.]